jgi:arylsulfatase A-like enzyme
MQQKWANAYDEATRVPMLVKGPGVASVPGGLTLPTSHVDLIPTLMGLAGIDPELATAELRRTHTQVRPLPGRDLAPVLTGSSTAESAASPVYFMTDDDVTRGLSQRNLLTGEPFDALDSQFRIESVVTSLPTGADGADELLKLNHYHGGLGAWHADHGVPTPVTAGPEGDPEWELHNLSVDPEERHKLAGAADDTMRSMQSVLEHQRDEKRLLPR